MNQIRCTSPVGYVVTVYEDTWDGNDATYSSATHFSYDIHGNIKELVKENQHVPIADQRLKDLKYDFDLISGVIHTVTYQENMPDQFIHKYEYDADNSVTATLTSRDNILWDRDSKYFYYQDGTLARIEIGNEQVQGIDYAYTVQGWVKGVNSNTLDSTRDIGQDGNRVMGNPNGNFAKDVYGYTLNYFSSDYLPIGISNIWTGATRFESELSGSDLLQSFVPLFNGATAISVMSITNPTTKAVLPLASVYRYDQLYRLISARTFDNLNIATNIWQSGSIATMNYGNEFAYDENSNIRNQRMYDEVGNLIEDLTYHYAENTSGKLLQNRLYHISDNVGSSAYSTDVDDQGAFNNNFATINSTNNYRYDGEGRLVRDGSEEMDQIAYTLDGNIKTISRSIGSARFRIKFDYDESGLRIAEHIYDMNNILQKSIYYVRDEGGMPIAGYEYTYDINSQTSSYKLRELYIYDDVSRLGILISDLEMIGTQPNSSGIFSHIIGDKRFELVNNLGSVVSVVSDKKIAYDADHNQIVDGYFADVTVSRDFNAYGTIMQGRNFVNDAYKFGYSGLEQHDEIMSNMVEASYRFLNTSVGRWTSSDPSYDGEEESPYVSCYSNPVFWIDPQGLKPGGTIGPIGKFIEFVKHPFNPSERAKYKQSHLHLPTFLEAVQTLFKPLRKLVSFLEGHKSQVERIPAGDYRSSMWVDEVGGRQRYYVEKWNDGTTNLVGTPGMKREYTSARIGADNGIRVKSIVAARVDIQAFTEFDYFTLYKKNVPIRFGIRGWKVNIPMFSIAPFGVKKYSFQVKTGPKYYSSWLFNPKFKVKYWRGYTDSRTGGDKNRPWWHKWFYAQQFHNN